MLRMHEEFSHSNVECSMSVSVVGYHLVYMWPEQRGAGVLTNMGLNTGFNSILVPIINETSLNMGRNKLVESIRNSEVGQMYHNHVQTLMLGSS